MSSKASIFLTKDNEHWYEETNESRYSNGQWLGDDIHLEFDNKTIVDFERDDNDTFITIRGNSDLAEKLRTFRRMEWRIIELQGLLRKINNTAQSTEGPFFGNGLDQEIQKALSK